MTDVATKVNRDGSEIEKNLEHEQCSVGDNAFFHESSLHFRIITVLVLIFDSISLVDR